MNNDEKIDDELVADEELVAKVLRNEYKGKTFDEHLARIKARQQVREAVAESANNVVYAGNGTAVFGGSGRTSAHRKQIWISSVAIAMCIILLFSLIGGFLYVHFREPARFDPILESDLNMVEIDYLTLQQQNIFVPNLSSLTDVIILRGNHRETEETIMFRFEGRLGDSRVTIRIVVHADFMPSDQEYFEDGSYIAVDQRNIWVNSATQEGRHFYWLYFTDNNIRYYVVLTTFRSGEHLALLNEIFQERPATKPPNPPNDYISMYELRASDVFKLNLDGLNIITVKRRRESGRVLMYVVEGKGYFGGCHMFLRIMADAGYIPDDIGNFAGKGMREIEVNGQEIIVMPFIRYNNQYVYRIMFSYDKVLHLIELTTPNNGGYESFLNAIL